MSRSTVQSGFSAIELLITIFVAAAFLAAGYQLYATIVRNGSDTRNQTTASNVAYDYMRRYSPQATNPCTVSTPVNNVTVTDSTLPSYFLALKPAITVTLTCPYGAASGTTMVTSTITYGLAGTQKKVQHATYVTN